MALAEFATTPNPTSRAEPTGAPPDSIFKYMPPDRFRSLDGYGQEAGLVDRMRAGDFATVEALRPDFGRMSDPLTPTQRQVAADVEELTRPGSSDLTNFPASETSRKLWAIAHTETVGSLWVKLSRGKKRREEDLVGREKQGNPDPNTDYLVNYEAIGALGEFPPAILYRALLERRAGIGAAEPPATPWWVRRSRFPSQPDEKFDI